ncbi:hypothetical protein G6F24_017871 [Rhizopus arrhizus]|nr:hypothetical protein G6F24_017871 [Rhizopus arrhizus]
MLRAATENPTIVRSFGINVPLLITLPYALGPDDVIESGGGRVCGGGDRRHRIAPRRVPGGDAGGVRRDFRSGVVPFRGGGARLPADGVHSSLQARRAVQTGLAT